MSWPMQHWALDNLSAVALLMNVSIKVAVGLAIAAVACRLLHRQSAAVRHRVWTIAVVASLLMPLAVGFMPHLTIANVRERSVARLGAGEAMSIAPETATISETIPISAASQETVASGPSTLADKPSVAQLAVLAEADSQPPTNPSASPVSLTVASGKGQSVLTSSLVLSLWMIGISVVGTSFFLSLLVQWSRKRGLKLVQDDCWNASVSALSRKLKLDRPVTTFESDCRTVPALFGVLRPYLVVPDNWREWSDEQRTCILLHELAHVKRFDIATQFLGRVAVTLYWFNPLAWYAVRQLRVERELACDDCVLMSGQRASDYAQQLLRTLKLYGRRRSLLFRSRISRARANTTIYPEDG